MTIYRTPTEYVELIDEKYQEAIGAKRSRMSVEWGLWSRKMNLELRERIEAEDPEEEILKYVYIYWLERSKLVEWNYQAHISVRGKLFGASKRKKIQREAKRIKKLILAGKLTNEEWGKVVRKSNMMDILISGAPKEMKYAGGKKMEEDNAVGQKIHRDSGEGNGPGQRD